MTPQQLWKLAYRTCESKLRKSGAVFSEAEIMEEFPTQDYDPPFTYKFTSEELIEEMIGLPDILRGKAQDIEEQVTEAFERKVEESKG